jgi:hypothetical protein
MEVVLLGGPEDAWVLAYSVSGCVVDDLIEDELNSS